MKEGLVMYSEKNFELLVRRLAAARAPQNDSHAPTGVPTLPDPDVRLLRIGLSRALMEQNAFLQLQGMLSDSSGQDQELAPLTADSEQDQELAPLMADNEVRSIVNRGPLEMNPEELIRLVTSPLGLIQVWDALYSPTPELLSPAVTSPFVLHSRQKSTTGPTRSLSKRLMRGDLLAPTISRWSGSWIRRRVPLACEIGVWVILAALLVYAILLRGDVGQGRPLQLSGSVEPTARQLP